MLIIRKPKHGNVITLTVLNYNYLLNNLISELFYLPLFSRSDDLEKFNYSFKNTHLREICFLLSKIYSVTQYLKNNLN